MLGHHGVQLRVDVAPLAHPAHVDEVVAQQGFVLAVAEFVRGDHAAHRHGVIPAFAGLTGIATCRRTHSPATRLLQPLPQFQVAAELALVVIELGMRLVGSSLGLQRTVAHVLHAQRAGDDQHLVERATFAGLHDHAGHARVQRQAAEFASQRRDGIGLVDRAKFGQQLVAVGDGAA